MAARRLRFELDQALLHVGRLDRGHRAAHVGDARHLGGGFCLQRLDLAGDLRAAVEDVAVLQKVGLEGHDLLQAQRPLLVPRPRQAERLVPRRQLHRAGAGVLAHHHGQHFQEDAIDVVLGLLLGEAERVHLDAVAEQPLLGVGDAIAVERDVIPQLGERPHLAHLGDEADAGIDEEGDAADDLREIGLGHLAARPHRVEHGDGVGEREGKLLHRRGARFLQVIAADVHRVPLGNFAIGEADRVGGQPERRLGREDVGPAREVLLDDVVLGRALQLGALDALSFGGRDIKSEQPRRRRVDGHRRVHAVERDAVEQGPHVAEMADRHADLADLALGQRVIGVVAGLGRQIEGDREPGLTAAQVGAVELVRFGRGRMAGIGADQPGSVAGGHGGGC